MGIARGLWRVETGVILSPFRRGRGILTPPCRRAFWPGGKGRHEDAGVGRRVPAGHANDDETAGLCAPKRPRNSHCGPIDPAESGPAQVKVVLNWFEEVERRVPGAK